MDLLLRHSWPGNVRELENVMERAVILLQGEYISEKELPLAIQSLAAKDERDAAPGPPADFWSKETTLADMEKQMIEQVLKETGGNKSEAARRLGITRRTLKLKLKKYCEEWTNTPISIN
jgi:two-component system response regulator HydG